MFKPDLGEKPSLSEVRKNLEGAALHLIEQQKTEPDKRDDAWKEEVRSAQGFIETYDMVEKALAAGERNKKPQSKGPNAALDDLSDDSHLTPGQRFTQSQEYREWSEGAHEYRDFPKVELRALLDSGGDDNAALLRPVGQPYFAPQNVQQRRLFIRDVITTQQTGLASVPYIRELNSAANAGGATATAEGSDKAEATMEFEQDDAPARKITAWVPATTEILSDAPTLRGYIDTRLTYMIKLREEAQVLNGPGGAVNLKGITSFDGTEEQGTVADDLPAVVGLSISQIEANDGNATAVAMNAVDFWKGQTERHANQFDNGFGGTSPAAMSGLTWGLPVVRTNAMTAGSLLVGDFVLGATLFDREAVTVRSSDSHDDYFIKNKVAIVAEERIALAVHRPDWFVEASITWT